MSKTSKEWLQSVKQNPDKFNKWLANQWLAEVEAAARIQKLADTATNSKEQVLLSKIASDEARHADLLKGLCNTRGIKISEKSSNRYYDSVKLSGLTRSELFAVGHYAEGMRLSRIEAICVDTEMPSDITTVFQSILKDEQMHEKAFKSLTDKESLEAMRDRHELGVQALGLTL